MPKNGSKRDLSVYFWLGLRLTLGFIFLWAFFDKLVGLGFETVPDKGWIDGGSPTKGFLSFATKGPLKPFYIWLGNYDWAVNFAWMGGLLFVGVSMIFGVLFKLGSYAGAFFMFLAWSALLPPVHNPILDEHVVYIFSFLLLSTSNAGNFFGLGKRWKKLWVVKKYKFLE